MAMSALRFDKDLSEYYQRKTAEGKNKMSVINAIRNKLLLRIFAVVWDNRTYVEIIANHVNKPLKIYLERS